MGGMISNGITVQIQRRADQEAFLRAFWEFRESVKRSLRQSSFSGLSLSHNNQFNGQSPCFDKCLCNNPGVFYPHKNVMMQLDPQCMMRDNEIPTLWRNLHNAMDLVWDILNQFDGLRNENGSSFRVQYLQYNEHGAIDLLSWEQKENKLFILYTICYLTIFPEAEGEQGFLEKFETAEDFKIFLEDLTMAQYVKISPLLRIFFATHNFGDKAQFFDPENDMENMVEFFFKRSYYRQISDTAFNVYTAAVIYGNSMQLKNFGEKRHREVKSSLPSSLDGGANPQSMFHLTQHTQQTQAILPISEADPVMERKDSEKIFEARSSRSSGSSAPNSNLVGNAKVAPAPDLEDIADEVEEVLSKALSKLAPQQNIFGRLMDKLSQHQEAKDRYDIDFRSSLNKSAICFVLQTCLNFGLLMMNPEVANWGDETEESPINFRHFINCTIIIFTFYYVMTMSISQFHIHTSSVVRGMHGVIPKCLVLANFFVNTVLAMAMIYTTAVVLKRSADTLVGIVLDSTAIYFIVDLDDMMLGSTDEEILDERVLFTYIYTLINTSQKQEKGAVTQYLREERWWLIIQGYVSIVVLTYAFYAYFGTEFPHLFTY